MIYLKIVPKVQPYSVNINSALFDSLIMVDSMVVYQNDLNKTLHSSCVNYLIWLAYLSLFMADCKVLAAAMG